MKAHCAPSGAPFTRRARWRQSSNSCQETCSQGCVRRVIAAAPASSPASPRARRRRPCRRAAAGCARAWPLAQAPALAGGWGWRSRRRRRRRRARRSRPAPRPAPSVRLRLRARASVAWFGIHLAPERRFPGRLAHRGRGPARLWRHSTPRSSVPPRRKHHPHLSRAAR